MEALRKKPKPIVLGCDWSAPNWDENKRNIVTILIKKFLSAGFSIVAITGPEHDIQPIQSVKNIDALLNATYPLLPSEAVTKISEIKNSASDSLFVLDYFGLNNLLAELGILSSYRDGDIYAHHLLASKFIHDIMQHLSVRKDKTNIVINSSFFDRFEQFLSKLGQNITFSTKPYTLISSYSPNIKALELYQAKISSLQFYFNTYDLDLLIKLNTPYLKN